MPINNRQKQSIIITMTSNDNRLLKEFSYFENVLLITILLIERRLLIVVF